MNAIFYIARTGCQWKALPRSFGASSPVHDRFQEWRQDGVFKRMWIDGLKIYEKKVGINWKWQSYNIKCEYLNPLIRMGPVGCETNLTYFLVPIFNSLNHISIGSNTKYNDKRNYLRF